MSTINRLHLIDSVHVVDMVGELSDELGIDKAIVDDVVRGYFGVMRDIVDDGTFGRCLFVGLFSFGPRDWRRFHRLCGDFKDIELKYKLLESYEYYKAYVAYNRGLGKVGFQRPTSGRSYVTKG